MPQRKPPLILLANRRFLTTAGTASISVVIVCALAPVSVQLAVIGIIASLVLGILFARTQSDGAVDSDFIQQSFMIAKDEETLRHHQTLTGALARTVQHADPLFRSLALKRIAAIASEAEEISWGTIIYEDTETWRLAYEHLLRSPGLHLYRSVALIHTATYWQDEPGRQSMRLNFEMQDSETLSIERTVIIADDLWRANEHLPDEPIRHWINEQHTHGIWIRIVRLSALLKEPDLQADFGIYGSRAVGFQELNLRSKTMRFILSFDFARVREAEERWERLAVYASSYRDLLERPELEL